MYKRAILEDGRILVAGGVKPKGGLGFETLKSAELSTPVQY